jgi:pimeloyl-ACP methyl ester carboxylesterase
MKKPNIHRLAGAILAICSVSTAAGKAEAQSPIVASDKMIESSTPGLRLFLRNKHRQDIGSFNAEKTLLFVHGSTYPAETSFDLPLGGLSWMDYIAGKGYDVWLVDIRGYGRSDRPKEMDEPAEINTPLVRTPDAVQDVSSAVDYILRERHIEKLKLMGWSWGTTIMGMYTASHNSNVVKLVLYATQWIRNEPSATDKGGPLGAYRLVSVADAKGRWLNGVAPEQRDALIPAGWFEEWADATFATDPVGRKQEPKKLRAPNGTVADTREFWASGRVRYDPADIKVPTLVIHAEWDHDNPTYMSQGVFAQLKNAPWKRFIEIGEGTHTVIMEKNRLQLFKEVQFFLDDDGPSKP